MQRRVWEFGIAMFVLLVIGLSGGFHKHSSSPQALEGPNQPVMSDSPQGTATASWAFPFVRWNERTYAISTTPVPKVGQQLGSVTAYSNVEVAETGVFSNFYEVGTKLFAIPNVEPATKIAIQAGDDSYVEADAIPSQ